jgi:hypothetical protein
MVQSKIFIPIMIQKKQNFSILIFEKQRHVGNSFVAIDNAKNSSLHLLYTPNEKKERHTFKMQITS